jgi:hypothetical protein
MVEGVSSNSPRAPTYFHLRGISGSGASPGVPTLIGRVARNP